MFNATILADTIFPNKARITTVELTFPRSILAEFRTHRRLFWDRNEELAMNAASSRAIPLWKMARNILIDPFIPKFRKNAPGMQGYEELNPEEMKEAQDKWLELLEYNIQFVEEMGRPEGLNIHKQYLNRPLEFGMWATAIVSATNWDNMFALRYHPAAEPSFQEIAKIYYEKYSQSTPRVAGANSNDYHNWHLPLVSDSDLKIENVVSRGEILDLLQSKMDISSEKAQELYPIERYNKFYYQDISSGRCAKVSYLNLETGKVDYANDIRLAVQLTSNFPGHFSPTEHQACMAQPEDMYYKIDQLQTLYEMITPKEGEVGFCGNYFGVKCYRKFFTNENISEFTPSFTA